MNPNAQFATPGRPQDLTCYYGENGLVVFEAPAGLAAHPFLDTIRMMNREEFARLVWSIKRHGLNEPICVTSDGIILDGRCRLMACRAAGIEPRFKTVLTDDPEAFICSLNIQRTHLSASQCAVSDALFEDLHRDDAECPIRVTPEARLVAQDSYLVQLVFKGLSLPDAYERALERQREAAARAKDTERFARLRAEDQYLAVQVDEGRLTVAQAVEAHEAKIAAPVLAEHADAIRALGRRMIADTIEIGRRLAECRRIVRRDWIGWLDRELGLSDRSALNFIRVYELALARSENFSDFDLPVSALYLLARPSTPQSIRDEVFRRAEAGEVLSLDAIKREVGIHKEPDLNAELRKIAERLAEARPGDSRVGELLALVSEMDAS